MVQDTDSTVMHKYTKIVMQLIKRKVKLISNQNSLVSRNRDSCNTVKDRETPVSNRKSEDISVSRTSCSTNTNDVKTVIPSQDWKDTQGIARSSSTAEVVSKTVLPDQNCKDRALKQICDSSNADNSGTVQWCWNEKSENITGSHCDSLTISPNMSDVSHTLPKYNCPLCSFKCDTSEEFTMHYENVHHVSSKSQDSLEKQEVCSNSNDVQNSKVKCAAVSDSTSFKVVGNSAETKKKTQENKQTSSSSKQSLTMTNNGHETTPPLMELSIVGDIQNEPIDNDSDDDNLSQ